MTKSVKHADWELQERSQTIVESKRLATLGQLAAEVAHEINNPLGGILLYAHLLLEDTGVGIPEGSLPFIFDEFFRVKRTEARQVTGTGLGLTIVKRTVEAHRGHTTVKSTVGQGSTFTVFLPKKQTGTEQGYEKSPEGLSNAQ